MMRKWWAIVLLGALFFAPIVPVHAAGAGFTVTPQLPKNQIGGNLGWFNLLVSPGEKQTLPVVVANQSDTAKTLKLQLTNAFTQDNGQVGYEPNTKKPVGTAITLTAMASGPATVNVAAHTGRTVTFSVTPPKFAGQVLGAVYVQDVTKAPANSSSGFAITNQFAMVVAVQLQESQNLVAPALNLTKVSASTKALVANIENTKPRLFGKMTLNAQVKQQGAVVFKQTDKDFAMAPNSTLNYQLTAPKALAPGGYQLVIDAAAGTSKWHFVKNFTLSAAAAKKLTPAATVAAKPNYTWLWGVAIVVAVLIGIFIGRRRKGGQ